MPPYHCHTLATHWRDQSEASGEPLGSSASAYAVTSLLITCQVIRVIRVITCCQHSIPVCLIICGFQLSLSIKSDKIEKRECSYYIRLSSFILGPMACVVPLLFASSPCSWQVSVQPSDGAAAAGQCQNEWPWPPWPGVLTGFCSSRSSSDSSGHARYDYYYVCTSRKAESATWVNARWNWQSILESRFYVSGHV
jgi:hypothetical protein